MEKTGAAAAKLGLDQDLNTSKVQSNTAKEEKIEYSEDEDENDELYIDEATRRNNGVATHIMYVHALCYREIKEYNTSL